MGSLRSPNHFNIFLSGDWRNIHHLISAGIQIGIWKRDEIICQMSVIDSQNAFLSELPNQLLLWWRKNHFYRIYKMLWSLYYYFPIEITALGAGGGGVRYWERRTASSSCWSLANWKQTNQGRHDKQHLHPTTGTAATTNTSRQQQTLYKECAQGLRTDEVLSFPVSTLKRRFGLGMERENRKWGSSISPI